MTRIDIDFNRGSSTVWLLLVNRRDSERDRNRAILDLIGGDEFYVHTRHYMDMTESYEAPFSEMISEVYHD